MTHVDCDRERDDPAESGETSIRRRELYGDFIIPDGLTIEDLVDAAKFVERYEQNIGDAEEDFSAIPVVARIYHLLVGRAEANRRIEISGAGGG